jgi:hypothetical protein
MSATFSVLQVICTALGAAVLYGLVMIAVWAGIVRGSRRLAGGRRGPAGQYGRRSGRTVSRVSTGPYGPAAAAAAIRREAARREAAANKHEAARPATAQPRQARDEITAVDPAPGD